MEMEKLNGIFWNNFEFFPVLDSGKRMERILFNNDNITFLVDGKIIFHLKYNSKKYLELMYVFCFEKNNEESIKNGLKYLVENYGFEHLIVDDVGMNGVVIDNTDGIFKPIHKSYHYFLGIDGKLDKKKCII